MTRHSRLASCRGKAKFDSENAADRKIAELADEPGRIPRRTYRCEWCFFWHLTHLKREPSR